MVLLTVEDIEKLALGCAVLGSGGGGDSTVDQIMCQYNFEKYGPVELISLDQLKSTDLVAPCDFMGAPLVAIERVPNCREFDDIFKLMQSTLGRTPSALVSGEIGGGNAFTAMTTAAKFRLPLVDGDLTGRAFPQLQMCSAYLYGVPPTPAFLADGLGNSVVVHARDAFELERIARSITVAMGSHCALSMFLMDGKQAKSALIPGSYTRAISIGKSILEARKGSRPPVEAVIEHCDGVHLGQGLIVDVDQNVKHGILEGTVKIQTPEFKIELFYQGEYLLARKNGTVIATTPDILTLLECESGTPISSECLRYGLKVDLIALPAPEIWTSPNGTTLVGPRLFGHDEDYQPVKAMKE